MDWDKLRAVGEQNREHSREKTRGEGKVQLMDKAWPISGMKIKDSDDWAAQHMRYAHAPKSWPSNETINVRCSVRTLTSPNELVVVRPAKMYALNEWFVWWRIIYWKRASVIIFVCACKCVSVAKNEQWIARRPISRNCLSVGCFVLMNAKLTITHTNDDWMSRNRRRYK